MKQTESEAKTSRINLNEGETTNTRSVEKKKNFEQLVIRIIIKKVTLYFRLFIT